MWNLTLQHGAKYRLESLPARHFVLTKVDWMKDTFACYVTVYCRAHVRSRHFPLWLLNVNSQTRWYTCVVLLVFLCLNNATTGESPFTGPSFTCRTRHVMTRHFVLETNKRPATTKPSIDYIAPCYAHIFTLFWRKLYLKLQLAN